MFHLLPHVVVRPVMALFIAEDIHITNVKYTFSSKKCFLNLIYSYQFGFIVYKKKRYVFLKVFFSKTTICICISLTISIFQRRFQLVNNFLQQQQLIEHI